MNSNIKIINRVFYIITGSLINLLISNLNQILSKINEQESLNDLLDNLNNIYFSLLSYNYKLNLSSKEIHILHETIKIISILSFNNDKQKIEQDKKLMIDFIQKKLVKNNKEMNEENKKVEFPKLKTEKKKKKKKKQMKKNI